MFHYAGKHRRNHLAEDADAAARIKASLAPETITAQDLRDAKARIEPLRARAEAVAGRTDRDAEKARSTYAAARADYQRLFDRAPPEARIEAFDA